MSSVTAHPAKGGTKPADVTEPVDDVDGEEITAGAEGPEAPSGPGAEDFVWDEEESQALR